MLRSDKHVTVSIDARRQVPRRRTLRRFRPMSPKTALPICELVLAIDLAPRHRRLHPHGIEGHSLRSRRDPRGVPGGVSDGEIVPLLDDVARVDLQELFPVRGDSAGAVEVFEEDLTRGRGTREAMPGKGCFAGAEQAGAHTGGVAAEDHAASRASTLPSLNNAPPRRALLPRMTTWSSRQRAAVVEDAAAAVAATAGDRQPFERQRSALDVEDPALAAAEGQPVGNSGPMIVVVAGSVRTRGPPVSLMVRGALPEGSGSKVMMSGPGWLLA